MPPVTTARTLLLSLTVKTFHVVTVMQHVFLAKGLAGQAASGWYCSASPCSYFSWDLKTELDVILKRVQKQILCGSCFISASVALKQAQLCL